MKKIVIVALLVLCAASSQAQFKFYATPTRANFTNVAIGDTSERDISVAVGSSATNPVTFSVTSPNLPVFVITANQSGTIAIGKTDTIRIRFKPTSLLAYHDTLVLTHNGDTTFTKSPTLLILSGLGTAPDTSTAMIISPTALNFGTDTAGKTLVKTFTIINESSLATKVLSGTVGAPSTANYHITSGGGAFTLNKGDTQKVIVSFTAPVKPGTYFDTINISSNADVNKSTPPAIMLTATVPGPDTVARINVLPSLQFISCGTAPIGKTVQATAYIVNTTNVKLTLTGTVSISASSKNFSIASGGGAFSLGQGDSQKVVINFMPDSVGQFIIDSLIITSNSDVAHQHFHVTIYGSGTPPDTLPKLVIGGVQGGGSGVPYRINFGNIIVGTTSTQTFSVTNGTDGESNQLSGTIGGLSKPQFSITSGGGSYSLGAGKFINVTISFSPTDTSLVRDTLTLTSNDTTNKGANTLIKFALSGSGLNDTSIRITVTPLNVDFGTVAQSSGNVTKIVSITNSSGVDKTVLFSMTNPQAPFRTISGGGQYSLPKGASFSDTVTFDPVIVKSYQDSIVITSNAEGLNQHIVVRLEGIVSAENVSESNLIESVSLNPNPAQGKMTLHFSLKNADEVQAAIFDIRGSEVRAVSPKMYNQGDNEIGFDVSQLSNGVYYLRLLLADGVKTVEFVVEK